MGDVVTVLSQSFLSLSHISEDSELTEDKVHFLLTEEHLGGSRNLPYVCLGHGVATVMRTEKRNNVVV